MLHAGGATKGQGLKGLLKPQVAKPAQTVEPSKAVYKASKKPSKTQPPVEQQKIEQQTQQQEEEPIEQQTQQQEIITQQEEQKIEQQPQQQKESKSSAKGILKWEQRLEPTQQRKDAYVPRKSILHPQVLEVQKKVQQTQQLEEDTQQQQEQFPVKQATEPKTLLSLAPAAPKLEPQPILVHNVHQVPTFFNADAGWE